MNSPEMSEILAAKYDRKEDDVCILYKYRSCDERHISNLENNSVWFSTQSHLNDPFDCSRRIPDVFSDSEIEKVRANLAHAQPYTEALSDPGDVAEYVGECQDVPPLISLGLCASQVGHNELINHIRKINFYSKEWTFDLIHMARAVIEEILHNVTIFSLSERCDQKLMWAHYADSHRGFSIGYIAPTGIGNPRIIHKVKYTKSPSQISAWSIVEDPWKVFQDLVLTKPSDWSYEREWRVIFGNFPGLTTNLLPYREVILGSRMSAANEHKIRSAVGDRDVVFYRAIPESGDGTFGFRFDSV